jgi:hypothetical protein
MNVKHENYDLILENYVFSEISVNFSKRNFILYNLLNIQSLIQELL